MKKRVVLVSTILVVFAVSLVCANISFAERQTGKLSGTGWAIAAPLGYNDTLTGTEPMITVNGTVVKIEKISGLKDSLQMRFKSDEGEKFVVWMGPRWFIVNQKVQFNPGDNVEIRGLKYKPDTIIGSEISKDEWTMVLRTEGDGLPVWDCCIPRVRQAVK
jgi:hypothetical protein